MATHTRYCAKNFIISHVFTTLHDKNYYSVCYTDEYIKTGGSNLPPGHTAGKMQGKVCKQRTEGQGTASASANDAWLRASMLF